MPANVELKARLSDLESALRTARELTGTPPDVERQVDTYFVVPRGRLKLRRRWTSGAPDRPEHLLGTELVQYERADEDRPRRSDYQRLPLDDETRMRGVFALAIGIDVEVEKTRSIWVHEGVRIHVDAVRDLGAFLEFEALVTDECDEEAATHKVEELTRHFELASEDVVRASYRELVREVATERR